MYNVSIHLNFYLAKYAHRFFAFTFISTLLPAQYCGIIQDFLALQLGTFVSLPPSPHTLHH